MFTYLTHTLRNGLKIVFVPTKSTSLMVNLIVGVGSKHENQTNKGISHFLEHMAFKGTKRRPDKLSIVKKLDEIGAAYNAGTSKDRTSYWIKSTPDRLELMLDILSDITFHSLLLQKEIDVEKGVIIEEINMYQDDPPSEVWDLTERVLFGDNPLGWNIIGTKKIIFNLKRKDFVDYQKKFYSPKNMVLAIGGGLKKGDWNRILDLSRKWFGGVKAKPVKELKIDWQADKKRELIKKQKTEQTHIVFIVPAFGFDDERIWPLSLIRIALGGNMSSRLWEIIRENRGWAYYVGSIAEHYKEAGYFGAKAGLRNDKAQEAIDLIKKEMLGFAKTVTEKEIEEAKGCIRGRALLSLESSGAAANIVAWQWLLRGEFDTVEQILKKREKVTFDQVKSLAKDLFSSNDFYLAAIGPNEKLKV